MASISKKQNKGGAKQSKGAGSRPGTRRSSGAKPSGTNLSHGGGSAAKKSNPGASAARGKGARGT